MSLQERLHKPGDRRRDRSLLGGGNQSKRRHGEERQSQGERRPWVLGESSSAWHLRGDRNSTPSGRRHVRSCPPVIRSRSQAGSVGGPKHAPEEPQHSKPNNLEAALMGVHAFMMEQEIRVPLEDGGRQEWDPMLQEAALTQDWNVQASASREIGIEPPPRLQHDEAHYGDGRNQAQQEESGEPNQQPPAQARTGNNSKAAKTARQRGSTNRSSFIMSITKKVAQPLIRKPKVQSVAVPKKGEKRRPLCQARQGEAEGLQTSQGKGSLWSSKRWNC